VEKSEILAEAKALNLPRGLVVRSLDGRSFFLTEEEIDRKAVTSEANAEIAAIFGKASGVVLTPFDNEEYCAGMLDWLVTHDPYNEHWRKVSVLWMNQC
jgi:hypothetical protein